MKRSGLGRGLDALLPPQADGLEAETAGGLRELPLEGIQPSASQPRRSFDEDSIRELALSVAQLGVLQPVLVRPEGGSYRLIAGERRWRAARRAGLESIPALVIETDDQGALERALVENVHRSDLNPIEEAAAYKQLLEDGGLTQEALADRLGRNRVTITNALRLLDLPVTVQRLLAERRLTAAHGRALLALAGNPFLERVARRAADEGLSVRETAAYVERYQALTRGGGGGRRGGTSLPPAAVEAQGAISDALQTRVRVEMGKRKGRIVIDFVSLEELDRITAEILGDASVRLTRVSPD